MKQGILLSVMASTMIMAGGDVVVAEAGENNTFGDALKNGRFTAETRTFYFDRSFDEDNTGIPNARSLTTGGIFKYESGDYYGFKFGFAHYGSFRIGGVFTREEGKGTSNLGRDGEDISFMGEAYVQYTMNDFMIKIGRQQLNTPLANNHDLRMLPSVYEAVKGRYTGIENTMIEGGLITKYSGFTSKDNGFNEYDTKVGSKGLGYVYITNKSIEDLSLRFEGLTAVSEVDNEGLPIRVTDYLYGDLKYNIDAGDNTYVKAQIGSSFYKEEDNSLMYGVKVGTTLFDIVDTALLFNQIKDNSFKTMESGPMYSDWQQGYGNYEPSTAFGGQLIVRPLTGLSLKVGYVDVRAEEGYVRDDYSEFNFDGKYTINDYSKFRVRYSIKDQTDESDREDRNDFRVIYYLNF